MPLIKAVNQRGDLVDRYEIPFVIQTQEITSEDLQIVRDHRRDYAMQITELSALQKQFARDKDFEGAKGVKDILRHFTSCEKAATLVINWWEKQTDLRTHDFPSEIHDLIDYEFNSICLSQDQRLGI